MRLSHNLLAGLANSIWVALIGLAVVPLYLKYLGIEAYGLIGFFATTQALLQLLDMGLAPTINREVARCSASGNLKEAGKLLHSLAIVYWTMAGVIALIVIAAAPLIAQYWIQSKSITPETISHTVMLMGLVVASRWPIGLYQGALMGAQRLTVSSSVSITMVTIGNLGAVAVLAFVSPTIEAFFIWQASVGLVYAATIRWAAWRVIGRLDNIRFDVDAIRRIWRFSAGMSGVAVSGIILMQLDKVLLSRMLSLEDFGRYALAGVVASGLYVLLTPTFNVIYPRLSALVVTGNTEKLIDLYRTGTRLFLAVLFPIAMVGAIYANEIIYLWTGNPALASSAAPIVSLLLMGTALNAAMHFPYALQLAFGMTRIPLIISVILTVILVPLIIYFTSAYGAVGAGLAWLSLNILYLLFGTWLTHQYILKSMALDWLMHDVGAPFCISFIIILGGWKLTHTAEEPFVNLLLGCALAFIAFVVSVLVLLRPEIKTIWARNFLNTQSR